ncbi:MAG: hypothetical protein IPH88_15575 [Bacteroidales bacterium]|nr:hypothetical protein [Bacteroidales bacterium]
MHSGNCNVTVSLYKSNLPSDRSTAISSMSGNLCRCTGYTPILDVAVKSLQSDGKDQFSAKEEEVAGYLLSLQSQSLELKSSIQLYHKPGNLNEALAQRKKPPFCPALNRSHRSCSQTKQEVRAAA